MGKVKNIFVIGGLATLLVAGVSAVTMVKATDVPNGLSVSPTSNKIVLMPGDEYVGNVTVSNPSNMGASMAYDTHVDPFFVNDEYSVTLGTENDYTKMKDWITLSNESGVLQAGESADVEYKISVPESAPAGGQYAAIVVATAPPAGGEGVSIREVWQIAMPIYASIAGESTLSGTISDIDMPSFLLNPPIQASFMVENTGNVHTNVTYYMQVFPLFSDEEIYTNEEEPVVSLVMPGTKRTIVSSWGDTPPVGIFRVVQTVKAFGSESVTEKTIIICPVWLLFLIFFAIIAVIIWIVMRVRARGKKSRKETASRGRGE